LAGKLHWLPLSDVTHLASFVPAESATLGIVDKGAWCWDTTTAAPLFLLIIMSSFYPRSNSGVGLKSNQNDFLQTWTSVDFVVLQPATPAKVQSAFMIDLNQVSLALRNATPRSLILLDEFGKGTTAAGSCISLRLPRLDLVNTMSWRNSEQMVLVSLLESCDTYSRSAPTARK
jgi:hypothetical protein